jgi:cytochrome c oxidase subunit 3
MTNLIRSNFQAHPFHLVSPSPWPLFTCISLLTLTTAGVLTMHGFSHGGYFLTLGFLSLVGSMSFWFRDVISEGTYLGNHTSAVQRGINLGVALFIVSEGLFFLAIFWAFFHKNLWIGIKLRGHPKALITKLLRETLKVASLMSEGIVTSLEIRRASSRWNGQSRI